VIINESPMKTNIFFFFLLSIFSNCLIAQYSQTTTAEFNSNTNVNISTLNNELKLTNDVGNGADGDLYIAPGTTAYTDAIKTYITGNNLSGQNALQVGSSAGFNVGDEVLVITMQDNNDDLNTNIAGQYEFKRILTKLSTVLIFTENLSNIYDSTGKKHQVLKVPNYNNVTIDYGGTLTCSDWDSTYTGGIVCFRAIGTVKVFALGKITTSYKGFTGGKIAYPEQNGYSGGGIFGEGTQGQNSNNSNGGGAGTRAGWRTCGGGGGGSYGTLGTNGVDYYGGIAGISVGNIFLSKLITGGAGGSGGNYSDYIYSGISGKGGDGGGIILLSCDSLSLLGQIECNGDNGGNAQNDGYAGGGGGGSGGTIYIISGKNLNIGNNFITSIGGSFGVGLNGVNGGIGGGGRIRIDAPSVLGSTNPPIGYNGINYALNGTSITQPLIKSTIQCWSILTFNKDITAPGTSVTVDVLSKSNLLLQSNVSAGSILNVTNDTIKLKITLLNSFGNQTPVFHDWMLTLATAPPAIITPTGGTTFCQGNSVLLNANTGAGYTYQWLLNGNIINGATNPGYTATQGGSYTVVVTSGCSATSLPVIVTVYPLPVANAGSDQTVCAGTSVILTATGGTSYQWDNGVTQGVSFIPTATTLYTVTVTNSNGCTATDNVLITVNSIPPTPTISQNGNILSSTAPTGNQWYLNGTTIPGATNQTFNVVSNGTYYVIVTLNGCNSDTSNVVHYTSGIEDSNTGYELSIYPNPNSGIFHIVCDLETQKEVSFKVIDYLGKSLYYTEPKKYFGKIDKSINLSGLLSGIYKLIVTFDNEIVTQNIAIQK